MIVLAIAITADIVVQRREAAALRKQLLAIRAKTAGAYELKIECDATDALAKIEQVTVAARTAIAELQKLASSSTMLQ